ncbi:MAG: nucleotidyltransferase family protein [Alteromonadaceae bacterium]|nr:nucleotidyltransferase family protein [Alteromonadaceae bacterium]
MTDKSSLSTVKKSENLAVIILAAGQSSRLGQPKQLVVFQDKTLLQRQCELALSVSNSVYCVLGYQADFFEKELNTYNLCDRSFEKKRLTIVKNTKWQDGMSSSISAGVSELPTDIDAVMIILVDQWQLKTAELKLMIAKWRQNVDGQISNILISGDHLSKAFNKDVLPKLKGPPTIFPKKYFKQLIDLTGENGAKSLLAIHKKSLEIFDYPEAFIDVDTPEQLQALLKKEE